MTRSGAETAQLVATARKRWGGKHRWRCVYCGRPGPQVDHFWPEALGGTSDPWNLVPACEACNSRKREQHPVEWMKDVGVPFERASVLWRMFHDHEAPAPGFEIFPRINLNYPAPARRNRAQCGTDAGYRRHRRLGEQCSECREAHRRANTGYTTRGTK